MQKYTQKYNNYINTNFKFPSKINFIHIITNILGLNNYLNISIIILLIIISIIYYYKNNDILFLCIIYLICILTIITIINAIQYYNTIVNKYIIYEPLANYKSDITNANTRLNLLLDPSNGTEFYNILTNTQKHTTSKEINNKVSSETLISSIKDLTEFNNFTSSNLSNIDNNSKDYIIPISNNIIPVDNYNIYYLITSTVTSDNLQLINNIYNNITTISNTITIDNINELLEYNYRPIKEIKLIYDDDFKYITISKFDLYNRYIYYDSILFINILEKLKTIYSSSSEDIQKYINLFTKIKTAYTNYTNGDDNNFINKINNDISTITSLNDELHLNGKINQSFFDIINNYINKNILTININLLKIIQSLISNDDPKKFFNKININSTKLDLSENINYGISRDTKNTYDFSISGETLSHFNVNISNTNIIYNNLYKTSIGNSVYIKVPSKIIDNNNREYYITISISNTINNEIIIFKENIDSKNIKLSSKFTKNIKKFSFLNDTTYNNTTTNITIISPYIVESINEHDNTNIDNFKKIILSSLINNLIHITTKYENSNLKSKLTTDLNNTIMRYNYSAFFDEININDIKYNTNNFINSDNNNSAYIVLLYNIYTYDKNRIIDIIEYFIYNKGEYSDIYTNTSITGKYLNTDILKIKTQIDKNIDKTPLILLYENNKYILNLILKLYDNLIKFIKKDIETTVDTDLCSSTSASIGEIEYKIYNHINKFFIITANENSFTATKKDNKFNDAKITKIGEIIKNYFNICVFLLNNIDAKGQIEETNKDLIISNFKFYNINGETINLDTSNIDNIRKELIIKCDYYNKYNSFNKKDKINMKYNADNVGYNFPILMIIFLIILSEIGFIKS